MKPFLALFALTLLAQTDQERLLKLEAELRQAQLTGDIPALERLTDPALENTNHHGQRRDRAATLALYRGFRPTSLTATGVTVKLSGDTALITGKLTEVANNTGGKPLHLKFLQVWVKRDDGWKIFVKHQEVDPTQGAAPAGWTLGSTLNFHIHQDTAVQRSGAASLTIASKHSGDETLIGAISQRVRADAYRGKRIRLTGYTKGHIDFGLAYPWFRVDGGPDATDVLSFDNRLSEGFVIRPEWKQFSMVLDVPEQSVVIHIGFQLAGRGQVWLDDWNLEVVGRDVPSTNIAPSESTLREIADYKVKNPATWNATIQALKDSLPKLPAAPVNLDFESKR